jgi:hypothetical protein
VPTSQRRIPGAGSYVGLPEPALDRVAKLLLERAPNVQEGRRTRAAVEVLVRAADREIDAIRLERERHGSDGVAHVPHLAGARAQERRDPVADSLGQVEPVVPGADELAAPLGPERPLDGRAGVRRQAPQ